MLLSTVALEHRDATFYWRATPRYDRHFLCGEKFRKPVSLEVTYQNPPDRWLPSSGCRHHSATTFLLKRFGFLGEGNWFTLFIQTRRSFSELLDCPGRYEGLCAPHKEVGTGYSTRSAAKNIEAQQHRTHLLQLPILESDSCCYQKPDGH